MELSVKGRFIGDIIEAIATAVERLLRDLAAKAVERFDKARFLCCTYRPVTFPGMPHIAGTGMRSASQLRKSPRSTIQ